MCDVYVYRAELYCEDCNRAIRADLDQQGGRPENVEDESFDSDDYPKGPHPDGGGESDHVCYCAGCGLFLENPLTEEGVEDLTQRIVTGIQQETLEAYTEVIDFYSDQIDLAEIGRRLIRDACGVEL